MAKQDVKNEEQTKNDHQNEASKTERKSRSDPERMWKLRMKFVKQARKYIGTPYAKKYFSSDSEEYHSPLFLDCCGLIRRAMYDLEKDFGFRIGPGNQSYMFDLLPRVIEDIKDVKPGDLVFISGTYYNPNMKKQRHNITHVEIMLGDNEGTLGARWNNGKVQEFDSYKFSASSFHSPRYYFKSIDPWLLGLCRSFCPKHLWPFKIHRPRPSKRFVISCSKKTKTTHKRKKTKSKLKTKKTKHKKPHRNHSNVNYISKRLSALRLNKIVEEFQ